MRRPIPSQRVRAIWLIAYAAALILTNYLVSGTLLPPTTGEGLWFYTAAVSLLLGDLIVHPYFVGPKDSLAFAVPAAIAVWVIGQGEQGGLPILGVTVLGYSLIVALVAVIAMLFRRGSADGSHFLANLTKEATNTIGHPKAILTGIFVLALFQFHWPDPQEIIMVFGTWAVVIGVQPERPLYWAWQRLRSGPGSVTDFGGIAAYQTPDILLVRHESPDRANFGTGLVCKDASGPVRFAIALDHTGRDEALLLRCLEVRLTGDYQDWMEGRARTLGPDRVGKIPDGEIPDRMSDQLPVLSNVHDFLGIVDERTDVQTLYFEVIRERDIEEGHLVEVPIRGQSVVYQIVDGLTKEDVVHRKHTHGYARAEARKIGIWENDEKRFAQGKWLPRLHAPVSRASTSPNDAGPQTIGHFPGSTYPVELGSVDELVTHNTAVLGILGIGKSMLAIELVERMIAEGVKVVCLDLTDQYANELADWHDAEADAESLKKIQEAGKKDRDDFADNPEEGGSFPELKSALADDLEKFISSDGRHLKILNPARFTATRQESEPRSYKDDSGNWQRGAPLWSVTPVQVTEVVAESLLSQVQDRMTDEARVCLVLEEAHSLVPEWNNVANDADRNATNGTARAILQGRKYGFGCLLVTQRTANVTKTILMNRAPEFDPPRVQRSG